jgi:hypothetical protein
MQRQVRHFCRCSPETKDYNSHLQEPALKLPASLNRLSCILVQEEEHKVGTMWRWNLGHDSAASLTFMLSARMPCEHFRIWVVR